MQLIAAPSPNHDSRDGREIDILLLHYTGMKSGEEAWQTDVGGQFIASPAVSDGRIVIGNNDGVLYCIGGKRASAHSDAAGNKTSALSKD